MSAQEEITRARAEIERAADHALSFATRRRVLRAFGPLVRDAKGHAVELGEAKRSRLLLARRAAARVAPLWRRDLGTDALERLLALIDGYLDGSVDRMVVRRATDALTGALHDAPTSAQREGWLAAKAVAGAGWVAVGDELIEADDGVTDAELDDPRDPDLWDPAFWAACAAAGATPNAAGYRAADALAFWQWYCDESARLVDAR